MNNVIFSEESATQPTISPGENKHTIPSSSSNPSLSHNNSQQQLGKNINRSPAVPPTADVSTSNTAVNGDHDDLDSNGANNLSASLSPVKVETTNGACIPPAIPPHNTATKVTV